MVKALVFAMNIHQYKNFCRNFKLNPYKDVGYIRDWSDCCGWWVDKPVILLEGYQYNKNYTLGLMNLVGHRFENIGVLSEGEIYNEGVIV